MAKSVRASSDDRWTLVLGFERGRGELVACEPAQTSRVRSLEVFVREAARGALLDGCLCAGRAVAGSAAAASVESLELSTRGIRGRCLCKATERRDWPVDSG